MRCVFVCQWGAPEPQWELFPSQRPFPSLLWDPRPQKNKNTTTLRLQWEFKLQGKGGVGLWGRGDFGGSLTTQRMFELMSQHHLDPPPRPRHADRQADRMSRGRGERTAVLTERKAGVLPAVASCAQRGRRGPPSLSPSVSICASPSLHRCLYPCLFSMRID